MTRASGKKDGEILCDHNFVNLVSELTNTRTRSLHYILFGAVLMLPSEVRLSRNLFFSSANVLHGTGLTGFIEIVPGW